MTHTSVTNSPADVKPEDALLSSVAATLHATDMDPGTVRGVPGLDPGMAEELAGRIAGIAARVRQAGEAGPA